MLIILAGAIAFIAVGILFGSQLWGSAKTSYYQERIREIQEALRTHPEDNAAAVELAMTLYLKGDQSQGIALAKQIAENLPEDCNALFNLGLMLADNGNYREAITNLEKIVSINPGFEAGKVRFYLGRSYVQTGNYRKALQHLQLAVQHDPGNAVAYYYLGQAHERLGNLSKAVEAFRMAIRLTGKYPEAEAALRRLTR